ncbi:copper homeostasis protein CutC [Microbacterium sp. Marseille-Q6965]|uniref:copper homeostasis protein CutC n=1 Tax=Microbacterium sp. Marseille-Q6965 TaxID=2965072 RepID=UPI0021B70AB0|nr:copper homeostasis protein CutC [Microbacterium sp. Marseille-Q6965]
MTAFELAVQDAAGLAVAARVRPDRIELCAALSTGGVTPSPALTEAAVATGVPVHVLVRPREGGFDYDDADRELIVADARHAAGLGVAGVVIGGLAGGAVDAELVRRVRGTVGDLEVTFHRAFDMLGDLAGALDELAGLGVTRVLTSGGASRAAEAAPMLRRLAERAGDRIQVMAGGGVTSANAGELAATGVAALHASAKREVVEHLAVALGSAAPAGPARYATVDEAEALAIRDVLAGGAGA